MVVFESGVTYNGWLDCHSHRSELGVWVRGRGRSGWGWGELGNLAGSSSSGIGNYCSCSIPLQVGRGQGFGGSL